MSLLASSSAPPAPELLREALEALGVRRLVLAIHDQSFPSVPSEDVGRGSPYSRGGRALFDFVRQQGFHGVQLGPQGDTACDNPSPYDGALFTKSPMSIALGTLTEEPAWAALGDGVLPPWVERRPPGPPDRSDHGFAWPAARQMVSTLYARLAAQPQRFAPIAAAFAAFQRRRGSGLRVDGLFQALAEAHGTDDWRLWPPDDRRGPAPPGDADSGVEGAAIAGSAGAGGAMARHAFGQFILAEQHRMLRDVLASASPPLILYGDLPIGVSHRDVWSRRSLFRADYLLGAPPSRTNPNGQPWGFPVLDPDQYLRGGVPPAPGPVLDLVIARVDALLAEFDGLRIDHPHGLVCPWVYAADDPDPAAAVGRGARLFCSPNLPDHPRLRRLAIPAVDQISADPGIARYADDWVHHLSDRQVKTYGILFDRIMACVTAAGRSAADVVCEVLSTWPYPLRRVMDRYDLGRFCVLQKADLTRPDDGYRAENASPRDWIMLGNHDTRSIWSLADSWHGSAAGAQWAAYLAERLLPQAAGRARLARWIAADARHLCQAMCATLFASRAGQVSLFFADLFGIRETYNRPGVVDRDNWTLRLPSDWLARHHQRLTRLEALNVPLALALAMAGRPSDTTDRPRFAVLVDRLIQAARAQTPTLDDEIVALLTTAAGAARAAPAPPV